MVDPKTTIRVSSKTGSKKYHAVPKEMCRTHPLEVVNMYCRREDTVGCAVCFTLEHKSCDDIYYIPECVQSNFPTKQVNQINTDLGLLSSPLIQDSSLPTATSSSNKQKQTQCTTSPSASGGNSKTNTFFVKQQNTKVTMPQKQGLYKVTDQSVYNIQLPDDKNTCVIHSSCLLDNGYILMADFSNNKLKLVNNRTYKVRSSLVVDARPWSVCKVSSTEAAVCLNDRTIQFLSTCGDKLVPVRSISMHHECRCIAVIRDKMYACDFDLVHIYTVNGNCEQTISIHHNSRTDIHVFSNIQNIAVSDDDKMIQVADLDNGVISFNNNGNVAWIYSANRLGESSGVTTDGKGNVIVCDANLHNVIQLSPDGQYAGEIADCVRNPLTVCYDRNNHKLIVGQAGNYLTVITFQ